MIVTSSDSIVTLVGSECSSVSIHLFGATIISWKSNGEEQLYLSSTACLDGSKPIRGGIPLVFPQFGPCDQHKFVMPQHGFARLVKWKVSSLKKSSVVLECKSSDHPEQCSAFPHNCTLQLLVELTDDCLNMAATVLNTGDTPFGCDWLFHTYLRVDDVGNVQIPGLLNNSYNGSTELLERLKPIDKTINVVDKKRKIQICRQNLPDLVIWNPGAEKAVNMNDLGQGEERVMLCVEAGHIDPPASAMISPGQSVIFSQSLTRC